MKHLFFWFMLCCFLGLEESQGQGGIWTWMKGDSTVNTGVQFGNYGVQGVSSPTNEPPGRYHPNYWTDRQGNFWLANGQIFNVGPLNDLWKYNLTTNEWTWMKGPQIITNIAGVYGTQGIPSPANYPSSGGLSGYNWADVNNNLWQYHSWGDVWKYSIATNEWTWMKGLGVPTQAKVLGVQGAANIANTPGWTTEYKTCWTDANDNLWIYLDGDMWRYELATNQWTWMTGPGTGLPIANYGIQGVTSATNQPGLSQSWEYWKDKNGNFLMGHGSYTSSAIWKFDPTTLLWTWVSGINGITTGTGATYISQCVGSIDRIPGKRIESRGANYYNSNSCEDYLWLCGGNSFGLYNDLWCYRPLQNTWTWVSGDSVAGSTASFGNYGIKGVPSPNNVLPRRQGHAMWVDSLQQVWVFGGIVRSGTSRANDLWRFTPNATCFGYQLDTSKILPPTDTILCKNESTTMTLDTSLSISIVPNTNYIFNADSSMVLFSPPSTTTYTVTGTRLVNNCPVTKSISFTIIVQEYYMPAFPDGMICEGESFVSYLDTLYDFTFFPSALTFQTGGDSALFKPLVTTTYTVTATKNECPVLDTANFQIGVAPAPFASFEVSPKFIDLSDAQIYLLNKSLNAFRYQWFIGNQLIDTTRDATYLASDTGQICFQLVALNQIGCTDTAENCGEVIDGGNVFIPNAFSPNGDLANDEFRIIGRDIMLKTFAIYNRWGEQLFYTDDITNGWNGTYKGENSEVGVYFYYIEYTNYFGKQFIRKGDVTLLR